MLQAKYSSVYNQIGSVHYKPRTARKPYIAKHLRRKKDVTDQLKKDWSEQVEISAHYHASRTPFIDMLLQFQSTRDGYLGCMISTKNCIGLPQPDTALLHSALYRQIPKALEFEEAEIDKMLAENNSESAQTECATPIFFVPVKDITLHFRVH